jgi:hypothetical protein
MERPFIVRFENHTDTSFDVVINHERQWEASHYARDYFGDSRADCRNRNTVEYMYSDFENNHTYHVTLG